MSEELYRSCLDKLHQIPLEPRGWTGRVKPRLHRAARLHMKVSQLRLQAKLAEHALDT